MMTRTNRQSSTGSTVMDAVATSSSTSFSQYTGSHDSSMISAITLDSALRSTDRLQFRFDPKLESLKEQKWAASPGGELEERFGGLRLPPSCNLNRFSDATEGTDTALCEKPQRLPSLDSFYKSSSSTSLSFFRTSTCSSDYRSSKSFLTPASFFLEEEEVVDIHSDNIEDDDDDKETRGVGV